MNVKPHLIGLALTILLVIAVACGGDGSPEPADTPATEATATVVPVSATSTPPGADGATGIPELDVVIDALRSGDPDTLRPLIEFRKVACSPEGQILTGAPECGPDEEDGELVDVFNYGVCEGQFLRPQQIGQALSVLAEIELYAVYRATDHERYPAEYVAVVSSTSPAAEGLGWAVLIEDGRIFRLSFSCAVPTEEFAEQFQDVVLPPQLP